MSQPRTDLPANLPAWRSLLFVPVTRDKFVASAHTRGADAIILDLEDSVAESEKPRGRTLIHSAAAQVSKGGADVLVRINRPWHHAFRDIEAAVGPGVAALMCPKVESPEHLVVIAELLDTLEAERGLAQGHTQLVALIETADAYFRAREIAKATPRLVALNLGAEDFATAVGMEPATETLQGPKQTVIIAARAAGIVSLGFMDTVADSTTSRPSAPSSGARAASASRARAASTRARCRSSTRSSAGRTPRSTVRGAWSRPTTPPRPRGSARSPSRAR